MARIQPPAKVAVRDRLLTDRRRRPLAEVVTAAQAIAGHLTAAPEVRRAATVAAYVSMNGEPGTFTCVLLYEDEVGVPVPAEPHDRADGWAATPAGVVRLDS